MKVNSIEMKVDLDESVDVDILKKDVDILVLMTWDVDILKKDVLKLQICQGSKVLTLYLMGGGIECLPLAKIAPVH